ncbi:Uncharacterised protein [Klebsiella pneumoniae]|nr:Uncharacterised protein [Klebsiella pneumoniae]
MDTAAMASELPEDILADMPAIRIAIASTGGSTWVANKKAKPLFSNCGFMVHTAIPMIAGRKENPRYSRPVIVKEWRTEETVFAE